MGLNRLIDFTFDETLSMDGKLKVIQNLFDGLLPQLNEAIQKSELLIPTIDGLVINIFNEWLTSGEFNQHVLDDLKSLMETYDNQYNSQTSSLTNLTNQYNTANTQTTDLTNTQSTISTNLQTITNLITPIQSTIQTINDSYGNLYTTYQNLQTTYNNIVADTSTHQTNITTLSNNIGLLYGELTALDNLVTSFLNSTNFYTDFNSNLLAVLNQFTNTVLQNTTDVTNLTSLLTQYETPINDAINQLTTITTNYQAEINLWNQFLTDINNNDNTLTQISSLLDNLNNKINRDSHEIDDTTALISQLETQSGFTDFTPLYFDVTAQSIFTGGSYEGHIGFWQVGSNAFILWCNVTLQENISVNTVVAPLPTPIQDTAWLPINVNIVIPFVIVTSAINTESDSFSFSITPRGVIATTNIFRDNSASSSTSIGLCHYFQVGLVT